MAALTVVKQKQQVLRGQLHTQSVPAGCEATLGTIHSGGVMLRNQAGDAIGVVLRPVDYGLLRAAIEMLSEGPISKPHDTRVL